MVAQSARAFEFGEESVALKLGLGKAIEQALDLGMDRIRLKLDQKLLYFVRPLLNCQVSICSTWEPTKALPSLL